MIIDRILKLIDYYDINKSEFYRRTKLSNGFLDKVKDIGVSKLEQILNSFPDINPIWLLQGKGEMLIHKNDQLKKVDMVNEEAAQYDTSIQRIPLYGIEATAGVVSIFDDVSSQNPIDYLHIPNLSRCDGAISVIGDSMYPILKSGDIVAFKKIHDINNVLWGEMYIVSLDVEGETFILVKFIQKSYLEDHIKLVSQNQHHSPKDVHIKNVKSLAIVKASVRYNVMV